ncbi:MAG: Wzz/FepE/Etk N-terminal domain-containing protein [Pseudomonadota bacterium]
MSEQIQTAENRDQASHSALPLLLILARRLKFLIFVPLAAGILAIIYSKSVDPIFTATARILPPQYNENTVLGMQNQPGGESQLGNSALTLKNPTDLFVGILTSRTIVDAVIERHALLDYFDEEEIGEVRRTLSGATVIRAAKNGIVSIAVEDTDPEMAAVLANAYVEEFYAFSRALARQQAQQRSSFYDTALDSAWTKLYNADRELAETEKETGFTRLNGQQGAIVQSVAELQGQIASREIQLETMSSYATATNPDVRLLRRELSNLKRELAEHQNRQQNDAITPLVGLGSAPEAMLVHAQGKRQVEYWEQIVMLLGRFSELGKIDETRDMSLFQVLDHAIPPHDKSAPRTAVNAILATLGTGFVCLMWVLVSDYIRQRRDASVAFDAQWQELLAQLIPFRKRSAS